MEQLFERPLLEHLTVSRSWDDQEYLHASMSASLSTRFVVRAAWVSVPTHSHLYTLRKRGERHAHDTRRPTIGLHITHPSNFSARPQTTSSVHSESCARSWRHAWASACQATPPPTPRALARARTDSHTATLHTTLAHARRGTKGSFFIMFFRSSSSSASKRPVPTRCAPRETGLGAGVTANVLACAGQTARRARGEIIPTSVVRRCANTGLKRKQAPAGAAPRHPGPRSECRLQSCAAGGPLAHTHTLTPGISTHGCNNSRTLETASESSKTPHFF